MWQSCSLSIIVEVVMYFQKLKNGRWRVRENYNNKEYSVYYDYKPTQKEARKDLNEKMNKDEFEEDMKFGMAMQSYINSKRNILTPETIRSYDKHYRLTPDKYKNIYISSFTNLILQNIINDYASSHNPTTTQSYYHFINSVLKTLTDKRFKVLLPKNKRENVYIPSKEDVELILRELKGTKYFTPIYLASYGLRVGEIMALTIDDISDCKVRVNKTLSHDENYKPIIKEPKTKASNRVVPVPKELTDKIKRDGFIYNGSSYSLNEVLHRIQKKHNIPLFSIHKLRHYLATTLHYMGKPKRFIESFGGWETNSKILERVYTHSRDVDEVIDLFDLKQEEYV